MHKILYWHCTGSYSRTAGALAAVTATAGNTAIAAILEAIALEGTCALATMLQTHSSTPDKVATA